MRTTTSMARKIPLTKGLFAIVDDEDYELVSRYKWHAHKTSAGGRKWYALHTERRPDGSKLHIRMHRLICGLPPFKEDPTQSIPDHLDSDGLNNRKSNLRVTKQRKNMLSNPNWSRGENIPPPPSVGDDYEICEDCSGRTPAKGLHICDGCAEAIWG